MQLKPWVGPGKAFSCVVVSVFAIVILSIIGSLFKSHHHSMTGHITDPEDGKKVAGTIFSAVIVYAVFLVFCSCQAFLHVRERRRGAISLS